MIVDKFIDKKKNKVHYSFSSFKSSFTANLKIRIYNITLFSRFFRL